jgi:hypothetical protein
LVEPTATSGHARKAADERRKRLCKRTVCVSVEMDRVFVRIAKDVGEIE